jgi:hypothetical protein
VALKTLEVRFSTNVVSFTAEMAAAAASVREFGTVTSTGVGGTVPTFQRATQEAGKLATAHRDAAAAAGLSATAHKQTENAVGSLAGRLTSLMTPLSALSKGGKEAADQVSQLGKAGDSLATSLAGGPEVAAAALAAIVTTLGVVMVKNGVESFLTLAGNARQLQFVLGGTAEDASMLSHVGQKLGLDVDTMGVAFGRLARNIGDNPAKLEQYGIAIAKNSDGTVNMSRTLENVADAYQHTVDPTQRAVMAQDLFSRGWVKLAPLLAQGRQGLEDIRKEADQHHEIFSQNDLDTARNYQFAMHNLQASVESLERAMASGVVPVLTDIANGFARVVQNIDSLTRSVGGSGSIFGAWLAQLSPVLGGLEILGHHTSEASKAALEQQSNLGDLGQTELEVAAATGNLSGDTTQLTVDQKQAAAAASEQKQAEEALANAIALADGSTQGLSGVLVDAAAKAHLFSTELQQAQQAAGAMYDAVTKATDPLTVANNSIQASVQAQQAADTAAKGATKSTTDQATALSEATRSSNEMASALHGIETANRGVADAERARQELLDFGLQDEATRTELDSARALEQETTATRAMSDAQKSLNDLLAFGLDEEKQRAALDAQSSALDHAQALEQQAAAQKKLNDIESGRVGMADSARPQAIADAQMELARANIEVQRTSLDSADAQRNLNDLQNGGQQAEVAAAEDKVTQAYQGQQSAILAANEAMHTLSELRAADGTQAHELADANARVTDALDAQRQAYGRVQEIQQSQAKAARDASKASADAAAGAAGAVTSSTNTISTEQARAHYTFGQWISDEQTSLDKTDRWRAGILELAARGHKETADQLALMGPEWASLVDSALNSSDAELTKADGIFGKRAADAAIAAQFNLKVGLDALSGIAAAEGYGAAESLATQLATGAVSVGEIVDRWNRDLAGGANSILGAIGGTLIPPPVSVAEKGGGLAGIYNPGPAPAPAQLLIPPGYSPGGGGSAPSGGGSSGIASLFPRAFGGIDDAHITNQEQLRVTRYGEPETEWEAYIPGASDRRGRAVAITQEVARRFGYELVPTSEGLGLAMADGGILPSVPSLKSGSFNEEAGAVMNYTRNAVAAFIEARRSAALPTAGGGGGPAPPGQLADWINQAIAITGVPASWAHGLYIIAMGETGGNPNDVNNWDSNAKAGNPSEGLMQTTLSTFRGNALPGHCVPLSAEILTRSGWKQWSDVVRGDETVGYNPDTGRNEWTPILEVSTFADQPVVAMQRRGWHARATPQHKWSVKRRVNVSRTGPITHVRRDERVPTTALRRSDQIRLAEQSEGGCLDIKPAEAALFGWLMGDGCVLTKRVAGRRHKAAWSEWGDAVGVASLFQAKPHGVAAIQRLLADVPHHHKERAGKPFSRSAEGGYLAVVHTWSIEPETVRAIMRRSRIAELGPVGFVAALSEDARGAWLDAMVQAEGNWTAAGTPYVCQNEGDVLDAVVLAAYLCGYRPSVSANNGNNSGRARKIYFCASHISGESVQVSEAGIEDVWCPRTGLGTWTMRFEGEVMLTSNSDIFNPIDNLIAAIRYILGRYHDISNVPGVRSVDSGGGYKPYAFGALVDEAGRELPIKVMDSGVGVLDPGWNVVGNFTGAPEPVVHGAGGGDHVVQINVPPGLVQVVQHNAGGNDPALLAKATKEVVDPAIKSALDRLLMEVRVNR